MRENLPRVRTRVQTIFDLRQLPRDRVAEIIDVNKNTVGRWIKTGKIPRSLSDLEGYAGGLGVSVDYLTNPAPCLPTTLPFFRSTRHFATQKLVVSAEAFGVMTGETHSLLREGLSETPRLLSDFSNRASGAAGAARDLRRYARLVDKPIKNMWEFAWSLGVVVVFGPKEQEGLSAYSMWVDGVPIVVLNSTNQSLSRWRFDIAHELGHLLLHRDSRISERRDSDETAADLFAGELLFPTSDRSERELKHATALPGAWQRLLNLGQLHGISLSALLKQATIKGYLDESQVRRWSEAYTDAGYRSGPEKAQPREESPVNVLANAARLLDPSSEMREAIAGFGIPEDVRSVVLSRAPTSVQLSFNNQAWAFQPELDMPEWST